MQKTPPKSEVSRGLVPTFTPANLSLSTMRAQAPLQRARRFKLETSRQ